MRSRPIANRPQAASLPHTRVCRLASPLDVVAIEIILFAEIHLAVGDDRRGPRGVTALTNLEKQYER